MLLSAGKIEKILLRSLFFVTTYGISFIPQISFGYEVSRPISEYLTIVEHTCIKHIRDGDYEKVRENLRIMNDFCNLGLTGFGMTESDLDDFVSRLNEARAAKQEHIESGSSTPWVCSTFEEKYTKFYEGIGRLMEQVLKEWGIHETMILGFIGHVAHETGWGRYVMGNNLFNIKGSYRGESIRFRTYEYNQSGERVALDDDFRAYPQISDSINQ